MPWIALATNAACCARERTEMPPTHSGKSQEELVEDAINHVSTFGEAARREIHDLATRQTDNFARQIIFVGASVLVTKNPKSIQEFETHFFEHFGQALPKSALKTELYHLYDRTRPRPRR
jgi:hypothetical protein